MQRLVLDQHRLVGAEEERLLLQPVGVVHASDHLADAPAEVSAYELEARELLEHAAHDQPCDRERAVHRAPDTGGKPIVAHALLAKADRRWMDHHRHIELLRQLENGIASSSSGYCPCRLDVIQAPLRPSSLIARSNARRKLSPP